MTAPDPAAFRARVLARLLGEIVPTGPVHETDTALGRKRNRNTRRNAQRQYAISPWKWKAVLAHFNHACAYCGIKDERLEHEHFLPLGMGGTLKADNVVCACLPCNRNKADKHPRDWLTEKHGDPRGTALYAEIAGWLKDRR